jgi:hypothetical protein
MPPKKDVATSKKSTTKKEKVVWGEVVEAYNVKEKEMKPMKVTKICKYESSVNKRPIFRLAGEDASTGQKMSKFASEMDAATIASVAGLKIERCALKAKVVKPKAKAVKAKAEKTEKAKAKPKAKAVKAKVEKAEKPKAKADKAELVRAKAKAKAKREAKAKKETKSKAK